MLKVNNKNTQSDVSLNRPYPFKFLTWSILEQFAPYMAKYIVKFTADVK